MANNERERERVKGVLALQNRTPFILNIAYNNLSAKSILVFIACFFMLGSLEMMKAHQKDGFFIEGGFESGLLQAEKQEVSYKESHSIAPFSNQAFTKNVLFDLNQQENNKLNTPYISTQEIKANSQSVFPTMPNCDPGCMQDGFDTKHMVEVSLDEYTLSGLIIKNYMPYSLNNLDLVAIPKNGGKPIIITTLESIGAFSSVTLDSYFDTKQLNFINHRIDCGGDNMEVCQKSIVKFNKEYDLELMPSFSSSYNTKRVMDALKEISVDIHAVFNDKAFTSDTIPNTKESVWSKVSLQEAKMYTSMIIDLAYLFSSKTWAEDILNAPFVFSNSLPIGLNGQVDYKEAKAKGIKGSIISKQEIIDSFRGSPLNKVLYLTILSPKAWNFLGLSTTWNMGVKSEILNPKYNKILSDPSLINGEGARSGVDGLEVFLHEYSHTRGWNSDFGTGNMTYPNVPKNPHPTKECPNGDYCINNKGVLPGYVGVSAKAWTTLAKEDKMPVIFSSSGPIAINEPSKQPQKTESKPQPKQTHQTQTRPQPPKTESKNSHQAPIKIHSTPSNPLNKENHHKDNKPFKPFSPSHMLKAIARQINSSHNVAMVGFDVKVGYQHYFNDFLGLAYYGLIKYNYSHLNISSVSQVGLGVGTDLLIDFFNSYQTSYHRNKFLNSLGSFIGFRGLYNGYSVLNLFENTGNLDFTTGINYRFKHSKYSIGVALPLIQHDIKAFFDRSSMQGELVLKEGVSHFNVFLNYGWVF
ncbi:putative outer membrane protein HomB [Helicobacter cetorum MIT 00-7128]|uniref:Putative outer membrane protein HomB n=1 Tax=Helicobacter cetorum (strain ATCC BAA-429 / MIT 00-7128) TaxID=182217 RepID=I0EM63_HELC0|nr:putative outer membrane protein HomB [Helicobacter cetorum MIT 00-7128]